ncbi:unnamed protein product, partial [Phaeothamnion confervicola]
MECIGNDGIESAAPRNVGSPVSWRCLRKACPRQSQSILFANVKKDAARRGLPGATVSHQRRRGAKERQRRWVLVHEKKRVDTGATLGRNGENMRLLDWCECRRTDIQAEVAGARAVHSLPWDGGKKNHKSC